MTTRYLDPEDGNDANDGLSFANRKKTLASVTASAAAGDETRLIASPEASLGTCDWTDNSGTIGVPSGLVKLIDQSISGWTPSTNVTASTSTTRKAGATTATLSIAAAFTTGLVGYKALASTLDLSAFQYVSFWINRSIAAVAGSLELRLCSDAVGAVPVHTIPLDDGDADTTGWRVCAKDFGGALSTTINSISIFANSDPGTILLSVNNVIAAKGRNASNHLSHHSLIGKKTVGEPEWYSIQSLDDTSVVLGAGRGSNVSAAPPRPYRGVSESVASYATRALYTTGNLASRTAAGGAGTVSSPVLLSGGWDRTAMSSQTGISVVSGAYCYTSGFSLGAKSSYNLSKIGFAHFSSTALASAGFNFRQALEGFWACEVTPLGDVGIPSRGFAFTNIKQVWGAGAAFQALGGPNGKYDYSIGRIHGAYLTTNAALVFSGFIAEPTRHRVRVGKVDNNANGGVYAGINSDGFLANTTFQNNVGPDISAGLSSRLWLHNCTFLSGTKVGTRDTAFDSFIKTSSEGGDPAIWAAYYDGVTFSSDTLLPPGVSGYSVKMGVLVAAAATANTPAENPLVDALAVKAGSQVDVTFSLYRTSTSLNVGIAVAGGWCDGVAEQRVDMTAAINTWQDVTLSFTPTKDGIVQILAQGDGAVAAAYFANRRIVQ